MKGTAITLFSVLSICIVIPPIASAYPEYPDNIGQPGGEPGAEFIYGDATGNDLVTADDVTVISAAYVGYLDMGLIQVEAADVDVDTVVNIVDSLKVMLYLGDYHSLDEKLLTAYDSGFGVDFVPTSVNNNTGEVWTEFHFRLDTYTSDFPYLFATPADEYSFFPDAYTGPGTWTLSNQNRTLDVAGLNIGVGESFDFSLNVDFDSTSSGYFGLFGQPTPIPEPNTMVFLSLGLIGLVGFRKKLSRK